MAAQEESLLQATDSFHFVSDDGVPTTVNKGAVVRVGHPVTNGREAYFAPLVVDYDLDEPKPVGRHASKPTAK